MTQIEEARIGRYENKMLREFKTKKPVIAKKKNQKEDEESNSNLDEETKIDSDLLQYDADFLGGGINDVELADLPIPSDMIANKANAENNPLVIEQRSGNVDAFNGPAQDKKSSLPKNNQGTKTSLCAVPII